MKFGTFSSTPLARKLGIKNLYKIKVINGPAYYFTLFTDFPEDAKQVNGTKTKVDFIHYFTMNKGYLVKDIRKLKSYVKKEGMIWISWPKKSSGIVTDISEDVIREIALKHGLVDTKVCTIDGIWSALKLVFPLKSRK